MKSHLQSLKYWFKDIVQPVWVALVLILALIWVAMPAIVRTAYEGLPSADTTPAVFKCQRPWADGAGGGEYVIDTYEGQPRYNVHNHRWIFPNGRTYIQSGGELCWAEKRP